MFPEHFRTKQVRDSMILDNQEVKQVFTAMIDSRHREKGMQSQKHEYLITVFNEKGYFLIYFTVHIS